MNIAEEVHMGETYNETFPLSCDSMQMKLNIAALTIQFWLRGCARHTYFTMQSQLQNGALAKRTKAKRVLMSLGSLRDLVHTLVSDDITYNGDTLRPSFTHDAAAKMERWLTDPGRCWHVKQSGHVLTLEQFTCDHPTHEGHPRQIEQGVPFLFAVELLPDFDNEQYNGVVNHVIVSPDRYTPTNRSTREDHLEWAYRLARLTRSFARVLAGSAKAMLRGVNRPDGFSSTYGEIRDDDDRTWPCMVWIGYNMPPKRTGGRGR